MKLRTLTTAIAMTVASGGLVAVSALDNTAQAQETFEWKLVTSWPKNFPGVGQGPERLARLVDEMSDGRLTIEVFGAGQLVPGFEVFDAVSEGTAEMGHSASYYWKGKAPAAQVLRRRALRHERPGDERLAALWWRPGAVERAL
ncbi:hypothetical protein Q671_00260 [Halomonas sp. PBN3]|nr:hypothetical protein Q671_00260 [Halomonas sp. PBN3]